MIKLFIPYNVIRIKADNMDVDKFLKEKDGNQNPFIIPDGYFKEFEKSLMIRILMQGTNKCKEKKLSPLLVWASCVAAIFIGCIAYLNIPNNEIHNIGTISANNSSNVSDEDMIIDEFTDYAMLNNDDIYSYISGE